MLIGDCSFKTLIYDHRQAEIGFNITPEFQGLGYASEAIPDFIKMLFNNYVEGNHNSPLKWLQGN